MFNVAELKAKTDLATLVEGDLGPPKYKNGRWLSFVCPFHQDSEVDGGSLRVTPDTGTWFCFGCRKNGDAISWLQLQHGLTFGEACQQLSGTPSWLSSPKPQREAIQTMEPTDKWREIAESVLAQAVAFLWSVDGERIRKHLHERGLSDETLKVWEVGYNPGLYKSLEITNSDGRPAVVSRGIVIPARIRGQLWGLKIRQPDGAVPKYLQLAGGHPALWGADTLVFPVVLLAEGEFDAMLTWQEAGDLVGVATTTGGAAVWRQSWTPYLLGVKQLLVAYDSDQAGNVAAAAVLKATSRAKRVMVPAGKDITEYWQQGGNLREWVAKQL